MGHRNGKRYHKFITVGIIEKSYDEVQEICDVLTTIYLL